MVEKTNIQQKEVLAKAKYIRISPYKLRRVANLIRGRSVNEAIPILKSLPQRGATLILKVLNSASANAVNNNKFDIDNLYVSSILINEGPRFRRYRVRARGRVFQVMKRTSHIIVGVTSN